MIMKRELLHEARSPATELAHAHERIRRLVEKLEKITETKETEKPLLGPVVPVLPSDEAKYMEASPALLGNLTAQLWRYYSVDFDVQKIEPIGDDTYRLYGSTEDWPWPSALVHAKFKTCPDKISVLDLYLWDGKAFIEPTTTLEEQSIR